MQHAHTHQLCMRDEYTSAASRFQATIIKITFNFILAGNKTLRKSTMPNENEDNEGNLYIFRWERSPNTVSTKDQSIEYTEKMKNGKKNE